METGVYMFPTDYSMPPDDLARSVEERGFGSISLLTEVLANAGYYDSFVRP